MSERKIKNDLPEALSKEEMIEKINQSLNNADYSTVYLTYLLIELLKDDS